MDRDDAIYMTAAGLIALGAGLYSVPAGAIAGGAMLALPYVISFFRANRKEPPK